MFVCQRADSHARESYMVRFSPISARLSMSRHGGSSLEELDGDSFGSVICGAGRDPSP
jgi:hypothetical protein